jgi:arsenate reductase
MSSSDKALNVLFLCTHNSARSILAEATLNHIGRGRFKAYSAGSSPRANQQPNPLGLQVLKTAGISTEGLYSKSWDEFATPDAPQMDLIITVCDNAAGEVCPVWPGHPATAHWGYADPSEVQGTDAQRLEAFRLTLMAIRRRLDLLINLRPASLNRLVLERTARDLARGN